MTDLLELAARCENATGGDRELDAEIALALGWTKKILGQAGWVWYDPSPNRGMCGVPPEFTASLDAAMTIVPEERPWTLKAFVGWAESWIGGSHVVKAATPALALCAACLKAIAKEGL